MSGIAAILRSDGRAVPREEIAAMTLALAPHGGGGRTAWAEGSIGLGHAALAPPQGERQAPLPWRDAATGSAITADARLDNRPELVAALGPETADLPDGRLILAAWARWGERCPGKLLGDFAFVVWDGRRRVLFAARDPFGARPIVYHAGKGLFALASEIPALLRVPGVPAVLDEAALAGVVVCGLEAVDGVGTLHRDIFRLPSAHCLSVSARGVATARYWAPDGARELDAASDDDCVEAFREVFREAVRCRLRGVAVPASTLSGGIDSSSIVAVGSRLLQQDGGGPLVTISGVSEPGVACPETGAIRRVEALPGLAPHELDPRDRDGLFPEIERLHLERLEPQEFDLVLSAGLLLAARRRGAGVLLDGVDGDHVASHEPVCLTYLLREGRWATAIRLASGIARFYGGRGPRSSALRLLVANARSAFVPRALKRVRRAIGRRGRHEAVIRDTLIHDDLVRRVDLRARLEALSLVAVEPPSPTLRQHQARALGHPYMVSALESAARLAAACGVEPRHPFFDRRLVELCLALPWEQKVRGGWTKSIVRRAMEGYLPDDVRWRRGRWEHLGPSFLKAFLLGRRERLRELAEGGIRDVEGYLDAAATREAFRRYTESGSLEDGERLWQAVCLREWLRRTRAVCAERLTSPARSAHEEVA